MKYGRFRYFRERPLTSPVTINLELTSACNLRCRHCYNFWRTDENAGPAETMKLDEMDKLIDMIIEDQVFHIVLTGGEPFINFGVLEHALKRLAANGVTTSVNSNLMFATPEKIKRLKKAGLDHILTSLNSCDMETADYMADRKGAFQKIISGMKLVKEHGIRISVNMIISEPNRKDVYKTAKLCAELGAQRIFGTRLVPAVNVSRPKETDFHLDRKWALTAVNDLLRAHKDFGIGIGTLISYPLCLLGDLDKYKSFVGRGCPAQRGNRMVINANGDTHACTHEEKSYGNVFSQGIKGAFARMRKWHNGSYLFSECAECEYVNICLSGCRSASYAYYRQMNGRDPLFVGRPSIKVPYRIWIPEEIVRMVDSGDSFILPESVRFRKEKGFYTINVRWPNAFSISSSVAEFLLDKRQSGGEGVSGQHGGRKPERSVNTAYF